VRGGAARTLRGHQIYYFSKLIVILRTPQTESTI